MFAGRHALSADLAALRRAERMARRGDPRAVWRETGWFRGPDGLWRWEIDDAPAVLLPPPRWDRAPRVLAHPELYRAYDCARLAVLRVQLRPGGAGASGSCRPGMAATASHCARDAEIAVACGGADEGRAAALHELQHVVQDREGFAPGAGRGSAASWLAYLSSPGEAEARAVEARRDLTAAERRALFPLDSYDTPVKLLQAPGGGGRPEGLVDQAGMPANRNRSATVTSGSPFGSLTPCDGSQPPRQLR